MVCSNFYMSIRRVPTYVVNFHFKLFLNFHLGLETSLTGKKPTDPVGWPPCAKRLPMSDLFRDSHVRREDSLLPVVI